MPDAILIVLSPSNGVVCAPMEDARHGVPGYNEKTNKNNQIPL